MDTRGTARLPPVFPIEAELACGQTMSLGVAVSRDESPAVPLAQLLGERTGGCGVDGRKEERHSRIESACLVVQRRGLPAPEQARNAM